MTLKSIGIAVVSVVWAAGCAGNPVSPFNEMEKGNVLVFRLQNYAPPAPAPLPVGAANVIPGLTPELQQMAQAAAQGLQQLLPPGMLPPNALTPGAPAALAPTVPSFYGQPILAQTQVMDVELRKQLGALFGSPSSFEAPKTRCVNAEFGIAFGPAPGVPTKDFLVSLSCGQVQTRNFAWPHAQAGLKPSTVGDLSEILQKLWQNG